MNFLAPRNGRRANPAPKFNAKPEPDFVSRVNRPLPRMYAILDFDGAVLLECSDGGDAWDWLCVLPDARAKVDADNHARVFAYRNRPWSDGKQERVAMRLERGLQ